MALCLCFGILSATIYQFCNSSLWSHICLKITGHFKTFGDFCSIVVSTITHISEVILTTEEVITATLKVISENTKMI